MTIESRCNCGIVSSSGHDHEADPVRNEIDKVVTEIPRQAVQKPQPSILTVMPSTIAQDRYVSDRPELVKYDFNRA